MTTSAEPRPVPFDTADGRDDSGLTAAPAAELLDLLDDAYSRDILVSLAGAPDTAAGLAADCDCSRPTVYRRLNRLAAAGAVDTSVRYDADGHHRQVYRLRLDRLTVELSSGGCTVRVETVE